MDDDLTVFSWNLEKKSHAGMTLNPDTVSRVVSSIADVVNKGSRGDDSSFVGFLLEIKDTQPRIDALCKDIKRKYLLTTGKKISVTGHKTGGTPSTEEAIIVMSRGVEINTSKFDIQRGMRDFIEQDKANAQRSFDKKIAETRRPLRDYSKNLYGRPSPDQHRKLDKEPEWFRNGVIAKVRHGDQELRLAGVHAPGPAVSDKVTEVVDTIVNSAQGNQVDILIGDLNRRGDLPATHYEDLSKGWTSGTTFGKKEKAEILGNARWDRVLAPNQRRFDIDSLQPIAVTRPADLGNRLTDHAMIAARIKPRTLPKAPTSSAEPFTFNTPAPNIAGADLHSLEASKAMVQPADPTLLYEAASDRKSTNEQLQKQLEDNPLLNPSTEPASDPLSSPSATSPLTEPPPTTTTGADTAMEESAEAMEAMAAEGEEIAEVAELVLL